MPRFCPACGAEAPDQFRFCGLCAAPLEPASRPTPPAPPEVPARGARRWVTLLFADLTNFTRAAEKADPEAVYLTIRNALEKLAQPIKRLGGRVDRYVGDGFLAIFGLPQAHEYDPARAILAALEMQASMIDVRDEARQNLGWDVQLRVGINIGSVVTGPLDAGGLLDSSVFGHTVNLTKRLQEAARPGTILVSQALYRHTHTRFTFREPIQLNLKGIDGPVVGYEVIGQRAAPQPSRGLAGRATPLIGRDAESETLLTHLQRLAIDRRGFVALIAGEAGIGKTRLVEEALASIAERFTVVRAECVPSEAGSYTLLARVAENLCGIQPGASPVEQQQRLGDFLSASDSLAQDVGPVLRTLLGGAKSDPQRAEEPQQLQRRVYTAIRQLLAWLARRRPMVLVLDDLHWADPSSLDVLAQTVDLVHEAPLAFLAIVRSSARDSLPASLSRPQPSRPEGFVELHLRALSPDESERLIALLLSEIALPAGLPPRIVERTSGNPLLIEEVVRMLLDEGIIRQTPAGWQVEANWTEAVARVPDTVNGLILSRYDRVSPEQRRILDAAAVLGRSFSIPLLAAMTDQDEAELGRHLMALEEADFLRRSRSAGATMFFFRHALMQEAIYQTLLRKERRTLHIRAAEAVQRVADTLALDLPALVGHHLERAGSNQAVPFLIQAARAAADRYANQEAAAYYRQAAALLEEHDGRQIHAVDIALGLSELHLRADRLEAAREQLAQARTLSEALPQPGYRSGDIDFLLGLTCDSLGDHRQAIAAFEAAAAALDAGPDQCRLFDLSDVMREIGWVMCHQLRLGEAERLAEKALEVARRASDPAAEAGAHNLLAAVRYYAGRLPEAIASARAGLEMRERLGDVWGAASAQANLGTLYYKIGDWPRAEALLRQAIFVQQELGDRHTLGLSWNTLALLLRGYGRFDEARRCLDSSIAGLGEQDRPPVLTSIAYLNSGLLWLCLGETARAIADLERSLETASRIDHRDLRTAALLHLAEAHLCRDEAEVARSFLDQAKSLSEAERSQETRAELLRVEGRLLMADRRWEAALDTLRHAQALFRNVGHRYEGARLSLEIAEVYLARAREEASAEIPTELRDDIRSALADFRALQAGADIPRAENALVEVSARLSQAPGAAFPSGQQSMIVVYVLLTPPSPNTADEQESLTEAVAALTGELHGLARRYGAVSARSVSGLAYVFGMRAPEDAVSVALRAAQCGQAAREAGLRHNRIYSRRYGFEIGVCIGLAGGDWPEAIDEPEQASAFVSVSRIGRQAAAAAKLAGPNQIILTDTVAALAQAVYELSVIEEPGDARLPEPVYRLGAAKSVTRLPQRIPGSSPSLVGRAAETAALREWLTKLHSETRGSVLYLEAEAGMGKTRLLEDSLAETMAGLECLWGKCESFRAGISYWPLIDMLERSPLPDSPAARRLKSLLGMRPPDAAPDTLFHSLPPVALRQELFGSVREFLIGVSRERPCLLVVEDVHWLDLSSLDLFDHLLPLTAQYAVSFLFVARAEAAGPYRALISKAERVCRDRFRRVELSSLSEADSQRLILNILATPHMPSNLWKTLQPLAGHPLSLEEGLRYLVERGWLWQSNGRWLLAEVERRMPQTFKDLLLGRLDMLEGETLHVLQAAAVLGEFFDVSVLGRLVPGLALSGRLTELVERGWLLPATADQAMNYRFKHTLTRETLYNTLLASKRHLLHQRAGEAIEALYLEAQEEYIELLAYHFGHSSFYDRALHYLLQAAEKSSARHSLAECLQYYREAETLAKRAPYVPPKMANAITLGLAESLLALGEPAAAKAEFSRLVEGKPLELAPEIGARLWRGLGTAHRKMGDHTLALENYHQAHEAAQAWRNSQPSAVRSAVETADRELLNIELDIARVQFDLHQNQAAEEQLERVLNAAERQRFSDVAAEALNLSGGVEYRRGNLQAARRLVERSLSLYQMTGNRSGAAAAYANLGLLADMDFDEEAARHYLALSLEIYESLGNVGGLATGHNNLGRLERNCGRYRDALRHLNEACEAARYAELYPLLAQAMANRGDVLRLLGNSAAGLEALNEAASLCQHHGLKDLLCEVLWKRADCWIDDRQPAQAVEEGERAAALALELQSRDLLSEARRALGRAYRHLGQAERALELTEAAWQARRAEHDPRRRARFATEYALALRAVGREVEAEDLLRRHIHMTDLPESRAMLEEIARNAA